MNIKLVDITEDNFYDVINLKSDENQEKYIQIYERWVGSNTYFLALKRGVQRSKLPTLGHPFK